MDYSFESPSRGQFEGEEFLTEIVDYFRADPQRSYLLAVGTDSRQLPERSSFVSVVALHRKGCGGRYYWHRFYRRRFEALRPRIQVEAEQSLRLVTELTADLDSRFRELSPVPEFNLEVHVDIGQNGPTRDMIQEIVGMIRGSGYKVRTKPQAYCAAVLADNHA